MNEELDNTELLAAKDFSNDKPSSNEPSTSEPSSSNDKSSNDCPSNETTNSTYSASNQISSATSKLPKLLVENCNYENLKKLSFQKLNDLTRGSSSPATANGSNTELNKSKSLTDFATTAVCDEHNDLQSTTASDSVVESLKKENEQLKSSLKSLEKEKSKQNEKTTKELDELKSSYQQQIDRINKQLDSKTKELERIVMKYAMSEKQILDAQKLKDDFEKKLKDALKDKDSLMVRIKGLSNDKQSLMNAIDSRVNEMNNSQKAVKEKEAQLMQLEFKLAKEQESQTEISKKLDASLKQIDELTKELSGYREAKSNADEMTSINRSDLEGKCTEIIDLKTRNSELEDRVQSQQAKIKQLEVDNAKFEDDKRKLTSAINELKQEFKVCTEKIEANKRLKVDYDEKVEELEQCSRECELLRKENEELISESKAYRQKEGELLLFTDRLQTKTVQLQSDHNHYKTRCVELEGKFNELKETIERQTEELTNSKSELTTKVEQHQNELNLFAKKLAEESNSKEKLKRQKEELENENKIMKKKHLQSIKELNKELVSLRKKVEQHHSSNNEVQSSTHEHQHPSAETISLSSRTDSSNSLERTSSNGLNEHHPQEDNVIRTPYSSHQILNTNFTNINDIAQQLDKNVLMNKILSLQQQLAKLRSRIEFLEEHNATLLEDIKKKSKIIQNFILREESGVLSSNDMDEFKIKSKNQVSKKGTGVMASLYRNSVNDSNMTLELSLEINNKLQAVLEDTILKNITLKESLDTLGSEIEKMSKK